MNHEPPPISDPHSTISERHKPSTIPRAKGAALVGLVLMGCFAFACGIGILGAIMITGVGPLLNNSISTIDREAVVGTLCAAILGILCCWGGYHLLRMAFGNQR